MYSCISLLALVMLTIASVTAHRNLLSSLGATVFHETNQSSPTPPHGSHLVKRGKEEDTKAHEIRRALRASQVQEKKDKLKSSRRKQMAANLERTKLDAEIEDEDREIAAAASSRSSSSSPTEFLEEPRREPTAAEQVKIDSDRKTRREKKAKYKVVQAKKKQLLNLRSESSDILDRAKKDVPRLKEMEAEYLQRSAKVDTNKLKYAVAVANHKNSETEGAPLRAQLAMIEEDTREIIYQIQDLILAEECAHVQLKMSISSAGKATIILVKGPEPLEKAKSNSIKERIASSKEILALVEKAEEFNFQYKGIASRLNVVGNLQNVYRDQAMGLGKEINSEEVELKVFADKRNRVLRCHLNDQKRMKECELLLEEFEKEDTDE